MGDVPPPEDPRIAAVATLARALLNVTLIQVLGYMMAKHKLLPEAALPGAGAFIGLVSLPAIYFRAVATLDFGTVRVQVLVALLLGKLLLVALSSKLGAMTQRKGEGPGAAEMRGGVFALLTTNSDDLGLGLPVLYPDSSELGELIRRADAGWVGSGDDATEIRAMTEAILDDPEDIRRRGENAMRLARDELAWDRLAEPLLAFCREPSRRPGRRVQPIDEDLLRLTTGERWILKRLRSPLLAPLRNLVKPLFRPGSGR